MPIIQSSVKNFLFSLREIFDPRIGGIVTLGVINLAYVDDGSHFWT